MTIESIWMNTCMLGLCWGSRGTSGHHICHITVFVASQQTALLWLPPVFLAPQPGVSGSRLQLSPLLSFLTERRKKDTVKQNDLKLKERKTGNIIKNDFLQKMF